MDTGKKRRGTDKDSNNALNLHPDYTFENFVVGKSNRLAHAACLAVAERPGKAFNPLYIHGDPGLGKTHLLHAIAHRTLELNPNFKVICLSAEKFLNDYIRAIGNNQVPQFQEELRSTDMLLVDYVDFLNDRKTSQDELLHVFNVLHENDRQIVIAANRAPSNMKEISEPLIQRFGWGLVVDVQPPDKALRVEILNKKAALRKVSIPEDVIQFLAQRIKSNVRELEGTLNSIILNSEVQHQLITLENVAEWLKEQ